MDGSIIGNKLDGYVKLTCCLHVLCIGKPVDDDWALEYVSWPMGMDKNIKKATYIKIIGAKSLEITYTRHKK